MCEFLEAGRASASHDGRVKAPVCGASDERTGSPVGGGAVGAALDGGAANKHEGAPVCGAAYEEEAPVGGASIKIGKAPLFGAAYRDGALDGGAANGEKAPDGGAAYENTALDGGATNEKRAPDICAVNARARDIGAANAEAPGCCGSAGAAIEVGSAVEGERESAGGPARFKSRSRESAGDVEIFEARGDCVEVRRAACFAVKVLCVSITRNEHGGSRTSITAQTLGFFAFDFEWFRDSRHTSHSREPNCNR